MSAFSRCFRFASLSFALAGCAWLHAAEVLPASDRVTLVVVGGAAGEAEFGQSFREQLDSWKKTGEQAGANLILIGADDENPATPDRARLIQALEAEPKEGNAEFWLVLVGHGIPFWIASSIYVTASILVFLRLSRDPAERQLGARVWAKALLIGVTASVVTWLVFERLFLVRLP